MIIVITMYLSVFIVAVRGARRSVCGSKEREYHCCRHVPTITASNWWTYRTTSPYPR
jgi:hypothetical protein